MLLKWQFPFKPHSLYFPCPTSRVCHPFLFQTFLSFFTISTGSSHQNLHLYNTTLPGGSSIHANYRIHHFPTIHPAFAPTSTQLFVHQQLIFASSNRTEPDTLPTAGHSRESRLTSQTLGPSCFPVPTNLEAAVADAIYPVGNVPSAEYAFSPFALCLLVL